MSISACAKASLFVFLWRLNLKNYRWFSRFLGFLLLRTIALMACGSPTTKAYGIIWMLTEPVILWWYLALAIEWHGSVVSDYPDVNRPWGNTIFRWGLSVSMLVTGAFTLMIVAALEWPSLVGWMKLMAVYMGLLSAKAWVAGGVALFLFIDRVHWKMLPYELPGNRWRHSWMLILYCSTQAAWSSQVGRLFQSRSSFKVLGDVETLLTAAIFVSWIWCLRRADERRSEAPVLSEEELIASRARLDEARRALEGATWLNHQDTRASKGVDPRGQV